MMINTGRCGYTVEELIKALEKLPSRAPIKWTTVLADECYDLKWIEIFEESATNMYYNPDPDFEGVESAWVEIVLRE